MVKLGKKLLSMRGGKNFGDDASVLSKFGSKMFSKQDVTAAPMPMLIESISPPPSDAPTPSATAAALSSVAAPTEAASSKSARRLKKGASAKTSTPAGVEESSFPAVAAGDEARDEAPTQVSAAPSEAASMDGLRDDATAAMIEQHQHHLAEHPSASVSADEVSYEETVQTSGDEAYDESGTINTYEEEEEEEEDCSHTEDENSYDCEENYSGTDAGDDVTGNNAVFSNRGQSVGTAKGATVTGNEMSKKYFHKDVVLNSLEDGANSLVIRAMYFIPKPKANDHVVVKIEASTISARDCMKCKGHGLTRSMLPFVPGFEVVGTIQTLGNAAKSEGQFREGDRVAGVSTFGGGNSRFISIPSKRLTKISNNVKSTQAVCMIADYMAALKALRMAKRAGSPFTGMNILITDGFSPIGQAVINLASMEGANIYCCADESKHAYLASLGAKCFVKDPEVWLPTATGTFDVVIDNSCLDSYSSSWFAINQKGSLVCIAPVYNIDNDDMPNNGCGIVDVTELKHKWAGIKAKYMMTHTSFLNTVTCYDEDTEQYKQDLRYLMFLLERGDVKPKVAERVSLDDVPDAQRLMQSGRANGTVVCVPWIEG